MWIGWITKTEKEVGLKVVSFCKDPTRLIIEIYWTLDTNNIIKLKKNF